MVWGIKVRVAILREAGRVVWEGVMADMTATVTVIVMVVSRCANTTGILMGVRNSLQIWSLSPLGRSVAVHTYSKR